MGAPNSRTSKRARRLREQVRAGRGPCHICGQPIDYSLEYPHPLSFSIEHIRPWSTHPHLREDPDNLAPAHLQCNQGNPNGKRYGYDPAPLGTTSREW
jgi:5-methylcytosine-specific restriction endonuclease McrA